MLEISHLLRHARQIQEIAGKLGRKSAHRKFGEVRVVQVEQHVAIDQVLLEGARMLRHANLRARDTRASALQHSTARHGVAHRLQPRADIVLVPLHHGLALRLGRLARFGRCRAKQRV